MDAKFTELVEQLNGLDFKGMYGSDFLHTWDKTTDELKALYIVADALRPQGHGRLGDVIDFGIYFLKSSCCHGLKLILFFHSHTPRSASGSR